MSGGSGGGTSTTVNQLFSPEEAARRAKVMAEAEKVYSTAGGVPPPAGASADTLAAQERLRQFSTGAGQQLADTTVKASRFGMGDVLYPESNPALRAYIDSAKRGVTESWLEPGGVLSNIRTHFGSQDGAGTREAIAMGLAGKGYANAIGDVEARMASEGYGKGLDVFSRTLAVSPQTYGVAQQPALSQGAIGTQVEAYQEAQREWEANAPWSNLQNYANVVFGGAAPGTQTMAQLPGMTNQQRAGMALAGASMGYMAAQGTAMGGPYGAAIGAGIGLLMTYL